MIIVSRAAHRNFFRVFGFRLPVLACASHTSGARAGHNSRDPLLPMWSMICLPLLWNGGPPLLKRLQFLPVSRFTNSYGVSVSTQLLLPLYAPAWAIRKLGLSAQLTRERGHGATNPNVW